MLDSLPTPCVGVLVSGLTTSNRGTEHAGSTAAIISRTDHVTMASYCTTSRLACWKSIRCGVAEALA